MDTAQQTAAAGATGAAARTDGFYGVAQRDAQDGCTREGGAIAYGLFMLRVWPSLICCVLRHWLGWDVAQTVAVVV